MDSSLHSTQDSASGVPTFLLKLVNMLNDDSNHQYVDWNSEGTSFSVKDQAQFSKIVLPKYFKHNKFASFVRQLNMYGFRKITSLTQSGLNSEREEVEFYHYLFMRGEEGLLEHIKRKVNKPDHVTRASDDVTKVLADVKQMKNHQGNINNQLTELKQENEDLWREVVNLRQKHAHQQKVVNKLIQFLVNLVHQTGMGVKRKLPLMIEDASSESALYPPAPKYSNQLVFEDQGDQLALEQSDKPTVSFPSGVTENQNEAAAVSGSGPYITEVTTTVSAPQEGGSSITHLEPNVFTLGDAENSALIDPVKGNRLPTGMNDMSNDLSNLIQPQSYDNETGQIQPAVSSEQVLPATVLQAQASQSATPNEVARYTPPKSPRLSSAELNTHVDMVQNNLENISELLFNNDQVELDYGLIQELFSTSPDIMPPADLTPANPDSGTITGNEVVLHSNSGTNDSENILESDFSDLSEYFQT